MTPTNLFKRSLFLFFCAFFFTAQLALAAGHAGVLLTSAGGLSAISADGQSRVLQKGSMLYSGDTVFTARDGRADIRFTDGSQVSLRPETHFRIDEYAYVLAPNGKPDGNETGFFSLLKGGFRTISGMIGKLRRSSYAVTTPSATIGIRGTEYTAQVDNGLHVAVMHGEISLDNKSGSYSVSEGERAFVANADATPRITPMSEAGKGGAGRSGASGASTAGGGVQIKGNTRIDANTSDTNAVAVGQGNRAVNQAGVIGGD